MTNVPLRQIFYTSLCGDPIDLDDILQQSRHNNAVDGITGLLWFNDGHFLQVLEGPADSVANAYARIAADRRHHDIRILSDRSVAAREFGYWSMERGSACADTGLRQRLARRLSDAPADIRAAFAASLAGD
ncbi:MULTISPECIES: BLUF domain-containing protein [unclassified Sphingomonas]|uniref:BLUF domain-containing protein n=1 Tax=unclassified Sphingomonas TaxID=196159 RepID=UPI000A41D72D|nr:MULTISPECIES: BLUF domain-containing protein [unclassified Sphingomonas]